MHYDKLRRIVVANSEPERIALRYIIRNSELPTKTRFTAQLRLGEMPAATSVHRIAKRCILSGNGRSVIGEFNINRRRFREMALAGQLVGVQKASW